MANMILNINLKNNILIKMHLVSKLNIISLQAKLNLSFLEFRMMKKEKIRKKQTKIKITFTS